MRKPKQSKAGVIYMVSAHSPSFVKGKHVRRLSASSTEGKQISNQLWARFGKRFRDDVISCVEEDKPGGKARQSLNAFQTFLDWLVAQEGPETSDAALLRTNFTGATVNLTPLQASHLLHDVFRSWRDSIVGGGLSSTSISTYEAAVAAVLQRLGQLEDRSYPPFARSSVSIAHGKGDVRTMGEQEWAELEGLSSPSARDAEALSLVKREALHCFADLVRVFERGQAILYGKHGQDADPASCRAVRDWLLSAHDGLRRGESLEGLGSVLRTPDRTSPQHTDGEVWRRAGFPNAYLDRLEKAEFFGWSRLVTTHLILPCLGPTLLSTVFFAKAFAAETGWNLQPIFDLPK